MRKVVDSNFLKEELLKKYLASSTKNQVVLIDYIGIEAYKGNIYKSMSLLCKYSNQVVVLKGTKIVCGLNPNSKGLQSRLIDKGQSRGFGKYCKQLKLAELGNEKFNISLNDHKKNAQNQIDEMTKDASKIIQGIELISELYNPQQLKVIRKEEPFTEEILDVFKEQILELTVLFLTDHPNVKKIPEFNKLKNIYLFRYSICVNLLAIYWLSKGGATRVNLEKIRNDAIDMHFVSYATYFDGLLSNDTKANTIYGDALFLIDKFFVSK